MSSASASRRKVSEERSDKTDITSLEDNEIWGKVYRATKVIFTGLLFLLVLGSAVVSKGSLLILTWNILTPRNGTQFELLRVKTLEGHFSRRDSNTGNSSRAGDTETNVYNLWAVFTLVVTPYFWSAVVSVWKLASKKSNDRTEGKFDETQNKRACLPWLPLLVAIVPAVLHSVGLSLLVFIILPSMDPLSGVWYCSCVTLVPSVTQLVFSRTERPLQQRGSTTRISWSFIGRVLCLVLSVTSLTFWAVYLARASSPTRLTVSVLSPVLVSFGWWENCVPDESSVTEIEENCKASSRTSKPTEGSPKDRSQRLKAFREQIKILKDHSYAGRHKIYVIIYTCKLLTTFVMMLSIYGVPCLSLTFSGNGNPVTRTSDVLGSTWLYKGDNCSTTAPFVVAVIGVVASFLCHRFSMAAVKIVSQIEDFSLPVSLVSPVTMTALIILSIKLKDGNFACAFPFPMWADDGATDYIAYMIVASAAGHISLLLLTSHIWTNKIDRMMKGNEIFLKPLYCGALLDQSLLLNRRKKFLNKRKERDHKAKTETVERNQTTQSFMSGCVPRIFLCATMWHEDENEMKQLLKSLFGMDASQGKLHRSDSDFYETEAHVFFDDAFVKNCNCVNQYVKTFITAVEQTARSENKVLKSFTKTATPYGGRLLWTLPEGNKLVAHLKDKSKIRAKKRWSQVMYMYYILSYILGVEEEDLEEQKEKAKNTFILALDGDVDFRPSAVTLLVDRMKRNPEVGAACGRIHPIGSGAMVWYQKFEYAISHWLVKATEHVAGCVLCSPGCFSLFRGSALMDKVMQEYTTLSTEARHYIQYDQGEDRWLCTLLLKQGYKVDYCAASDAYTFAPESFKVFYNQRRRWTPSTMANIMDILASWRDVTKKNNYISLPYIALHLFWFISSLVTPGVLMLMIVGATKLAYSDMSLHASLLINLAPVTVFVLVCFFAKTDVQITVAGALSIMYSLVMIIVLIGLIRQSVEQGFCSISTPFILGVIGLFITTGVMHPQETSCLVHGLLFFISIPSMSILLTLYSVINMNNVSWGTRENQHTPASVQSAAGNDGRNMLEDLLERMSCCTAPRTLGKEDDRKERQKPHDHDRYLDSKSWEELRNEKKKENEFWEWLISNYLHPCGTTENTNINNIQRTEEDSIGQKVEDGRLEEVMIKNKPGKSDSDAIRETDEEETGDTERLEDDEKLREEKLKKQESDLKELRNKASFAFLLINALSMTVVFYLQQVNADTAGELSIQLTCSNGGTLPLEPISLTFTAVFGFLMAIQFVCMLVHRCKTFLQINSITKIRQNFDVEQPCTVETSEQPTAEEETKMSLSDNKKDKRRKHRKKKKKKSRTEPKVSESNDYPVASLSHESEARRPPTKDSFIADSGSSSVNSRERNPKLKDKANGASDESMRTIAPHDTNLPGLFKPVLLLPAIGRKRNSDIAPVHT